MNKQELEEIFKKANKDECDVALELTVPQQEATEIIIVKYANLLYKLDYYHKNYNDNLELERCTDIKILKAKCGHFANII